jgi:hypothetical protein
MRGEVLVLPATRLTWPLVAYLLLAGVNAARGVVAEYPTKHLLMELLPILIVGTALFVGNMFERRYLWPIVAGLVAIAYASAGLGFVAFKEIQTHMAGVYFAPVPGMVALILFNLALRSKPLTTALAWLALSMPLFLHQFLSFGRGMWLGNLGGIIASILIFSMRRGSRSGWRRSGVILGVLVGVGIVGVVGLTVVYGRMDILLEAGTRFLSIGQTELKEESRANIERLMEYALVVSDIVKTPWFGRGLGYTFKLTSFLETTKPQYWVHENYLLVWLKQGILGLIVFVWMLWSAFRLSAVEARRATELGAASWLSGTAASTVLIAVFALTDFPFDNVEPMFLVALLWGGAMALARDGYVGLRWGPRDPSRDPDPVPESAATSQC